MIPYGKTHLLLSSLEQMHSFPLSVLFWPVPWVPGAGGWPSNTSLDLQLCQWGVLAENSLERRGEVFWECWLCWPLADGLVWGHCVFWLNEVTVPMKVNVSVHPLEFWPLLLCLAPWVWEPAELFLLVPEDSPISEVFLCEQFMLRTFVKLFYFECVSVSFSNPAWYTHQSQGKHSQGIITDSMSLFLLVWLTLMYYFKQC